jgi:hypothetical protein
MAGQERRLKVEPLEDRRMLANVTVSNLTDVVNGNTLSISALIVNDGGDGISLREAIVAANTSTAADIINFAPALIGTINLANPNGMSISAPLEINGPGANLLTVKAVPTFGASNSYIFSVGDADITSSFPVTISGLTLTGAFSHFSGGSAIYNVEDTTLIACTISGNTTATNVSFPGPQRYGGAILTSGSYGSNRTQLTIVSSTINDNSGLAGAANGGAIAADNSDLVVVSSTISGNTAIEFGEYGTYGAGGAIFARFNSHVTILSSTVVHNTAGSYGGGIYVDESSTLTVRGSIIAENDSANVLGGDDLFLESDDLLVEYSLIRATNGFTASQLAIVNTGIGNIIGNDPQLGFLSDNGGPTKTHALLSGSPAIDAGDPMFDPPPDFDQRGSGFDRLVGGRIDIGALEVQVPAPVSGDFDHDGDVDGRDFLVWQRNPSVGNLSDWQEQYGGEDLSAVSSRLEQAVRSSGIDESLPELVILVPAYTSDSTDADPGSAIPGLGEFVKDIKDREAASDVEAVPGDAYVEDVDRAVEALVAAPRLGVRSFGEMVVRRGVNRIFSGR